MTNDAYYEIAHLLLEGEKKRNAAALHHLVKKYQVEDNILQTCEALNIEMNFSNEFVRMYAWSLIGPIIADKYNLWHYRERGASEKGFKSKDIRRAEIVDELKEKSKNGKLSDRIIIEELSKSQLYPELFPVAYTENTMLNALTRGRRENKKMKLKLREIIQSK